MSRPWVLVLTRPNGAAVRRVGGLALALRLALDAERAGASGVVVSDPSVPGSVLEDARLRIPVLAEAPPETAKVFAAASLVVHRDVFKRLDLGKSDFTLSRDTAPRVGSPYGFDPVDVIDRAAARRAERLLLRSLRKPQDGWTSRYVNRYVSLAITRWLVRTQLRPNQVSPAILAVGLFGAWLASRGTYLTMLAGAFLFQMQSILDGCDGEMSRLTYRGSLLGEWLDTIGDDLTNYGFFAGAALGLHAMTGSDVYLAAGAIVVGAGVTTSFFEYRYLIKIGSGDLLKYPTSQTASGTGMLAVVAPLFKRDTFVLLVLIAALLDVVGPMLVVFALAALGILANVLLAENRMARMRRTPRPPASG